jgi:D-alanyl-D-alanine carboxypeptidase
MRLPLLLITAVLITACSSGGSADQPAPAEVALPPSTTEALNAQLTTTMARNDVPGAVVQVCIPGYEDWTTTRGVADVQTQEPMAADADWPIRSITKSVTVTLILKLVDEGKISLDDTIDQWVPDVPNGDRITLRQLADMSSGAPEYTTQAWIDAYLEDPQRAFTTEELIEFAVAEPAQFDPGAKRVYTNTNTLLLGQVVEQEYGQPFGQVVQEQILQPLSMSGAAYHDEVNNWTGPTGYQQGEAQDNNFTVLGPAGAMTATPDDLCTWGEALGQGSLLQPATQADRVQGAALDSGPEYDFYAQGIGGLNGWIGHTGEGFGHTVLVMHNPDSGATAVVAMNTSGSGKHVPTRYFRKVAPVLDAVPPAS